MNAEETVAQTSDERRRVEFANFWTDFVKRYRPGAVRLSFEEAERLAFTFERDLHYLITLAHEEAVRPFAYELRSFRGATLTSSMFAATPKGAVK